MSEVPPELAELRRSIDNIDAALVHLLAERFKCTQLVGQLKAERHLPAADPAREERQVARLRALADEAGLVFVDSPVQGTREPAENGQLVVLAAGPAEARETLRPFRKDVLAKLHAADISRKRKLLEKQKEGRKKLNAIGNVVIDQSSFQKFLTK